VTSTVAPSFLGSNVEDEELFAPKRLRTTNRRNNKRIERQASCSSSSTLCKKGNGTMIANSKNFYQVIDEFDVLPEMIDSISEERLNEIYDHKSSRNHKSIVYILRAQKQIPRLRGESDIIYIGQTKCSFGARYASSAKIQATSKANSLKYNHILTNYGPIRITVCKYKKFGSSLIEAEGQLLWWYFQNHCEYPPINYTKTKNRTESIEIENT